MIKAPLDGVVAKRQVQLGQRVQPGVPLLTVVPLDQVHVDANFRRSSCRVRVGQPVTLHADLYGSSVTYHGVVEGFSAGPGGLRGDPGPERDRQLDQGGAAPARIKLDPAELQAHPLRVGLTMSAEIDTRGGQQ